MSIANSLQKQISQLQSKLDSKRSRSRSRSRTPRREKANSTKKREKKGKKNAAKTSDQKLIGKALDDQRRNVYKGSIDFRAGIDFAKAKACVQKVEQAHERARDAKLEVWDHKKRVILENGDGKQTRFQTYAEWKASRPKSLLTASLQASFKDCKHEYKKQSDGYSFCKICGVSASSIKDEKTKDTIVEQLQELYDAACQAFETARNMIRAGFKNKPIHIQLVFDDVEVRTDASSTTVRTFTMNGSGPYIKASLTTEFNTMAAIFDEFRYLGGSFHIVYNNQVGGTPPAAGSGSGNVLPVIAYDPADNSAPSSSSGLCELAQHQIWRVPNMINTGGSNYVTFPNDGCNHRFAFTVPNGVMDAYTTIVGRQWIGVDEGSTVACGCMKFYHIGTTTGAMTTGSAVGQGLGYLEVDFRCRE